MKRAVAAAATLLALLVGHGAASAVPCDVAFDSNIYWFTRQARDTFAYPSTYGSDGHYQACPAPRPNTDTGECWMYRQSCTPGKSFTVFTQVASYYFLTFDDPTINCFVGDGMGRRDAAGRCVAADWGYEPRTLVATYGNNPWVEIAQKSRSTGTIEYTKFRLNTITLAPGPDIQLWYKQPDGRVLGWSRLTAGTTWTIDVDATMVWVGGASTNGGFTIERFTAETY